MKLPEKSKKKKEKSKLKKSKVDKNKKEQVLIVAQEIKFARLLSGNEKKTRDRVLKTLKKWLANCFQKGYEFKEDDFIRVWKGLFYAVWMSDKPLVQEELCDSIAAILDEFPTERIGDALMMTKAGLRTLATEWYGIDQHRMDKFLMLVRRYLRGSLRCLLRCGWAVTACRQYADMLTEDGILSPMTPAYARNATSMILHFLDCYLEEISKVSGGDIPADSVAALLSPACALVCGGGGAGAAAARRVLTALLRQSELGLRDQHRTHAWKSMGCPEGGPEALELVEGDSDEEQPEADAGDDEEHDRPLDPRAGLVDVVLTPLPVPAAQLAAALRDTLRRAPPHAHRRARICLHRFEQLASGDYPLKTVTPPMDTGAPLADRSAAARDLIRLEEQLVEHSDELALRGVRRKQRRRLLARARAGLSIVDDPAVVARKRQHTNANGDWLIEDTEPDTKKSKNDKDKTKDGKKKNKKGKHEERTEVDGTKGKFEKKDTVKDKKIKDKKPKSIDKERNAASKIKEKAISLSKSEKKKDKVKDINTKKKKETQVTDTKTEKVTAVVNKLDKKTHNKIENNINKSTNAHKSDKETKTETIKPAKLKKPETDKSPKVKKPTVLVNKVKNFQKKTTSNDTRSKSESPKNVFATPKRVKFALKNNSMQLPVEYYKSVRQSPDIPFDSSKRPVKTNLKVAAPSPVNPFFKSKLRL